MAKQPNQKGGGARKIGRNKRIKNAAMSAFVRGKISPAAYFKQTGLTTHFAYARKAFSLK